VTVSYVVRAGDTLTSVAQRFGVTVGALRTANRLTTDNLFAGQQLVIPLGSSSAGVPVRLQQRPERLSLEPVIDRWAAAYAVPGPLLKSLLWIESGWQNSVVSSVGAMGIGQLMPDTVVFVERMLGEDLDPGDPEDNIRMSARFLAYLLEETGSAELAIAAYQQGLGALQREGTYPHVEPYVGDVLAVAQRFR